MSRLSALPVLKKVDTSNLAPFSFRDFGDWVLITNEWGKWQTLNREEFARFAAGELKPGDHLHDELAASGFIRDRLNFGELAAGYMKQNEFRFFSGPSLHMIVVTLRCNQQCRYCHSSVVGPGEVDKDMSLETAKKTVDFIFATPSPTICIEFQGGEPLMNWPVVQFIIDYARAKAKLRPRRLILALVSNFTLMTDEKLRFLTDRGVSICTSLDGPADLHNANRPYLGSGEAQAKVVAGLKKIFDLTASGALRKPYLPSALMTTTRMSLTRGREIVDVYRSIGIPQIFLRPLSPIGFAKKVWSQIGYPYPEFLKFYEDTLDYILELNQSGRSQIMERNAVVLMTKILRGEDPGFMDLRSPSGAVLGCLAYNHDGRIFVSDEGRMVDHQGDPIFNVGRVEDSWTDVLDHPTARACVAASNLETQPMCMQCVYKPWCGMEPVFQHEMQGTITGQGPTSPWCGVHMGVFDILMKKLRDSRARAVFERWLERDQYRWQESEGPVPGQPVAREQA